MKTKLLNSEQLGGVSTALTLWLMCYLTEFCSTGFTEEAEEAETDGTGVNRNKSEHSLLTFLSVASFYCQCLAN